jgi:hypothetical protein
LPEPPKPANTDFEGKEEDDLTDEDRENKELADAHKEWEENFKEGEEKVAELTARFAPWYYVIGSESFDKIHLTRSDFYKSE